MGDIRGQILGGFAGGWVVFAGADEDGEQAFLLSFHQRDELAAMVARAGWRSIAARRADGVEQRFVATGAAVAVVDARDAVDQGLAAVTALGDAVEANAAALLILISGEDVAVLGAMLAAGATHFLVAPFGEAEFAQALRYAARHAERLAGGHRAAAAHSAMIDGEARTWRWRPGSREMLLSPGLAQQLGGTGDTGHSAYPVTALLKRSDGDGLRAARAAVTRLLADGRPTAFAQHLRGIGRVAHHIRLDRSDGAVIGRVEALDSEAAAWRGSRDALTGVADGRATRLWIERRLRAGPSRLVLLLLAVNRFDMVNAAYGRMAGDALLRGVARRIERIVTGAGAGRRMVGRMAGAEFAIAIDGGTIGEAALLARDLVDDVARSFVSDGQRVSLSARVGIAQGDGEGDADGLLRRASAALAEAKAGTSEAIRILDAAGEGEAALASRLEVDLRRALEAEEIEVRFQPQVSIATGQISGVEALARWRHPLLGELGAVTLFAAAQRSDFVGELSDHVRARALAEVAAWPAALSSLRVSLNVTAEDIARGDFRERCLEMIDQAGVSRDRVTLEVTESGLIEDLGRAASLMADLRDAGLRIAIDDFGTGYSSLAYLNTLPLDYLKLDRRLSQDIAGTTRERVVVRGVIEMAHSLGLEVIAEGVESEAELSLLAHEGVAFYQGFLFSEPLDSASLAERLAGLPAAS
jgi:diguanylate cyclase (GGDEF)-like protein